MMEETDMNRMSDILDGLINRTEEEKLTWKTSIDENSFITSVDTIGIIVRSLGSGWSERHRIEIQNDQGLTVQVLQTPYYDVDGTETQDDATKEQAEELSRLFALARRSALKTDLTLEKLADSLARR